MSGYCPDCGNTLCICDELPERSEIAGTAEFNDKYILIEKSELKELQEKAWMYDQLNK